MSCKYRLSYGAGNSERSLELEDFTDAVVCEGRVFLRERMEYSINTAPGQCWGHYIDVPAGAFVDGEKTERAVQLCIDDVGQSHTVTVIDSLSPLHITTTLHVGVEYSDDTMAAKERTQSRHIASLRCSKNKGCAYVYGFHGAEHTLLIPFEYGGFPVRLVDLRDADLENVETLIISEGIEELAIDFSTAYNLSTLLIPSNIRLRCPLDNISHSPWFRSQRPEPIYIAGCYCGTPGGGSGGVRSLVIPEGITSVAAGADFHSYWHSIKTPASLRSIGHLAFATCHCLEELNISEGLQRIESEAFYECCRLKSLYLPDSLQELGRCCFDRAVFLQDVSVPAEKYADNFLSHRITVRCPEGEKQLSKCPPIVVPLTDRISAYPKGGDFFAMGKKYSGIAQLTSHRLDWEHFTYLDIHGRKTWLIAAYDDGFRGIVERRYLKEDNIVTQIECLLDGTVLVREGIQILDVPHALRGIAARELFGLG